MLGRAATVRVMSSVTPRAALSALPDYAAGRPPQPVEGLEAFKLSSNENPHAPVAGVAAWGKPLGAGPARTSTGAPPADLG